MRAAFTRRARASGSASRCAGPPPEDRARPRAAPADAVAARIEDTAEGWRSWEAEHDIYDGPAPRARALQLARAEGPDLPADRRDRRRADHLAARDASAASATGTTASPGSATRA